MQSRPSITIIYLCRSTEPRKLCIICRKCRSKRSCHSADEQSDIRDSSWSLSPAYRCAHAGYTLPRLPQRRHHDQPDDPDHQAILQRVVNPAVPLLDLAAGEVNFIELAEHLVEHADMLAFHVLGRGSLDDVMADPAVDRGHEAILHRTFDVAEQDAAIDVGGILGAVNKRLVEHERLAVTPDAL